jgi:surface carbohydrate biosynthesis protein (TIGR04326 family)
MTDSGVYSQAGTGGTLHVWDVDESAIPGDWTTVLWRGSAGIDNTDMLSISYLVEKNADELRARYLGWIYDLGQTLIGGKRIIDHLLLRPGLSFWWMTSLAQQFNISGTSRIDDAIKAIALEQLVVTRQTTKLVLTSANRRLSECLQSMCLAKNMHYEWRQVNCAPGRQSAFTLYASLPHLMKAFIYLGRQVIKAVPLLRSKRITVPDQVLDVMFIDVLVHLDGRSLSKGVFGSNYWSALVGKLPEWNIKSNWVHLFFRHPAIPTPFAAQRHVDRFNVTAGFSQFHYLLERSLGGKVLWATLRYYFIIRRTSIRLREISSVSLNNSDLDLWPLHSDEWHDSIIGKEAMTHCLRVSLFEDAVGRFPRQRIGVYISENQPWEMALLSAWRASGHGAIVGVPHTTVRFWDLRYHHDPRIYLNDECNSGMPLPDLFAVNGPVALENMQSGGYPSVRLREVEALRFLHLDQAKTRCVNSLPKRSVLSVLICGDFLADTSRQMLAWLETAALSLPPDTVYVLKPHPAFPVDERDYSSLNLNVSESAIADLLRECDVVFTSNITSAAVDAYCSGVPVVQMLNGKTFNMSPLREIKDVVYVTNPSELSEALIKAKSASSVAAEPFFCLNEDLPRWRNLLCASSGHGNIVVDP